MVKDGEGRTEVMMVKKRRVGGEGSVVKEGW